MIGRQVFSLNLEEYISARKIVPIWPQKGKPYELNIACAGIDWPPHANKKTKQNVCVALSRRALRFRGFLPRPCVRAYVDLRPTCSTRRNFTARHTAHRHIPTSFSTGFHQACFTLKPEPTHPNPPTLTGSRRAFCALSSNMIFKRRPSGCMSVRGNGSIASSGNDIRCFSS